MWLCSWTPLGDAASHERVPAPQANLCWELPTSLLYFTPLETAEGPMENLRYVGLHNFWYCNFLILIYIFLKRSSKLLETPGFQGLAMSINVRFRSGKRHVLHSFQLPPAQLPNASLRGKTKLLAIECPEQSHGPPLGIFSGPKVHPKNRPFFESRRINTFWYRNHHWTCWHFSYSKQFEWATICYNR